MTKRVCLRVLSKTVTLRSHYDLSDIANFAGQVERMLWLSMNVRHDNKIEDEAEERLRKILKTVKTDREHKDDEEEKSDEASEKYTHNEELHVTAHDFRPSQSLCVTWRFSLTWHKYDFVLPILITLTNRLYTELHVTS